MQDPPAGHEAPRIAVDAEGGDHGSDVIVDGALAAASAGGVRIVLVGRPALASRVPASLRHLVTVEEAADVVEMGDDPVEATQLKRGSSVLVSAQLLRDGSVDGLVSCANTGAVLLATVARIGRLRGVAAPVIAVAIPSAGETPVVLVDAGSATDVPATWFRQFAVLGRAYASLRFGIDEPRVGLLSNGSEPSKGDAVRQEAHRLLADLRGYVGQVEGYDLAGDTVDVVVSDGFTGNVALKSYESGIRTAVRSLAPTHPGGIDGAVRDLQRHLRAEHGGAVLGLRSLVTVLHGSASAEAVAEGIRYCAELAPAGLPQAIAAAVRADATARRQD